jgi:glycosyltransferase involved in cell wall biosynthesis
MKVSAFTFVYNALEGGYPIREAVWAVRPFVSEVVVADCGSTDGTDAFLAGLPCRVIQGPVWGPSAPGEALALNADCEGDVVVHFQADEVYDARLLQAVMQRLERGVRDLKVHRIQIEQNFQRVRWYPFPVHRVWPRGSVRASFDAMTTDRDAGAEVISPDEGLLRDCAACFRDCWTARRRNQAIAWTHTNDLRVAEHFAQPNRFEDEAAFLAEPQWTWTRSPFDLPPSLKQLVGKVRYE